MWRGDLVNVGFLQVPIEEVTSIFFDFNEPGAAEAAPAAPPPAREPVTVAPTPVPAAPAAPAATAPARLAKIPPPYGPAEASFLANELRAHGARLLGKVVKLEFHCRGQMQVQPDGTYLVPLRTVPDYASLVVQIDKEAAAWFREIPETPAYLDRGFSKARGFYVYGVVIEGSPQYLAGVAQPVAGYTIQPIGRRTQRGMRGAVNYAW